ncbi:cation:dicarboxylate symporter family transporter, partial [Escherichia coli]
RVFLALGLGIILGLILHLIYGADSNVTTQTTEWISIVGNGYIALLQMIVIPLVFVSIVAAFTKIEIGEKFAKVGSY